MADLFYFEFNVALLFSPLVIIIVGWIVKRAKDAIVAHMDENRDHTFAISERRHAELVTRLDAVESQVLLTNGRVSTHDGSFTEYDKRFAVVEADIRMLTRLLKGPD